MHLNSFSCKKFFGIFLILLLILLYTFTSDIFTLIEPQREKNIFFVETKSPQDGISRLSPREACAIESASMMNPEWKIFIYVLNVEKLENYYWDFIKTLPSVHIKLIKPIEFAKGTPIENLLKKGIETSPDWLASHMSDVMRYTILYKYAGVYMDFDSISLKPLDGLVSNFAGQQEPELEVIAGSAVVGFGSDKIGRNLAKTVAEDIGEHYSGDSWVENGLGYLTRGVMNLCGTKSWQNATEENCHGFKLYPVETFYAIPYAFYGVFFNPDYYERGMKMIENSVVTHIWKHLSEERNATKGSKTVICEIAKRFCPITLSLQNDNCL